MSVKNLNLKSAICQDCKQQGSASVILRTYLLGNSILKKHKKVLDFC